MTQDEGIKIKDIPEDTPREVTEHKRFKEAGGYMERIRTTCYHLPGGDFVVAEILDRYGNGYKEAMESARSKE